MISVDRAALFAGTAGLVALATDALYLGLIWSEGDQDRESRIALVAVTVAAAGAAALVGAFLRSPSARLVLLTAASTSLLLWGILSAFSVGVPLFAAGALAALAASAVAQAAPPGALRASIAAAIGVVAFSVAGVVATG